MACQAQRGFYGVVVGCSSLEWCELSRDRASCDVPASVDRPRSEPDAYSIDRTEAGDWPLPVHVAVAIRSPFIGLSGARMLIGWNTALIGRGCACGVHRSEIGLMLAMGGALPAAVAGAQPGDFAGWVARDATCRRNGIPIGPVSLWQPATRLLSSICPASGMVRRPV